MSSNRDLKDILRVMLGNITTILSGVIVGFLLPKELSLADYGFYKTFTLYITYMGLFSLGIIDGIVLIYGGKDFEQLEPNLFRSYFKYFTAVLTVVSSGIILSALLFAKGETQFIFVMIGIDMVAGNLINYFRQISQITQRFKEYSARTILQSAAKTAAVLILLVLSRLGCRVGYRFFLSLIVLTDVLLTLWYIYTYRVLAIGQSAPLRETRPLIRNLILTGFPLLFSNLTVQIIMALDRQFVSVLFSKEDYAIYAFAYNMLSLVAIAISAISTVLYPTLKRKDADVLKDSYDSLISIILMLVFGALLSFFPLCWILEWFLQKYLPSIEIFRIIFPGLAISSAISIVMHNYYKVMDNSLAFFRKSIVILILSAAANAAAYYFFRSMASISMVSILTLLIWYVYAESYFVKTLQYRRWKNLLYMCLVMASFYLISGFSRGPAGAALYLLTFLVISLVFFKDILKGIKNRTVFK